MPAKSAAVKKPIAKTAKTIAKKPVANKNTKPAAKPAVKKPAPKAVAKKPVAKTTSKSVAKTKTAAKPAAKSTVKAAPAKKTVAKAPVKKPVAKIVPAKKAIAAKPAPKAPVKKPVAAKAVAKPVAVKPTTAKTAGKAPNMSVEDAVARVMKVVGKKETPEKKAATDVKTVSTVATAKVAKAAATPAKPAKNDNISLDYKAGDMVVYPAHGVGQVEGVETLSIGGLEVTLYTITFAKDRMRLKLPLQKIKTSGLRPLSTKEQMQTALQTMRGRARIKRVMWSRRAQEYEAKINSGSPIQVAEVLRDLRRNATGAENSYSERQIFQSALERLASELAAIEKIGEADAAQKLQNVLTEAA